MKPGKDSAQAGISEHKGVQAADGVLRGPDGKLLKGTKAIGKPWKPGQSGNPNGRALEAKLKHYIASRDNTDRFVVTLMRVAMDPTHPAWAKAAAMVFDRADGGVAKKLELTGDLPLKVTIRGSRDGSEDQ